MNVNIPPHPTPPPTPRVRNCCRSSRSQDKPIYTYVYIYIITTIYIYIHIYIYIYINLPVGDCFFNPFMFLNNIRAKLGLVYDWVCSWHFFASKLVSGRFFSYWVTRTALQQLSSCPRLKICGQPTSKPQSTISLLSLHMRWCSEISHEKWSTALGWHWWPDVQGQLWLSPLRLFQYVALFWKQIGGYTKWSSAALSQFRSELALHRTNFIVAPTIQQWNHKMPTLSNSSHGRESAIVSREWESGRWLREWLVLREKSSFSMRSMVLVSSIFSQAQCTATKESRFLARLGGGMYCSTLLRICSPHVCIFDCPVLVCSCLFIGLTAEVFTVSWAATCGVNFAGGVVVTVGCIQLLPTWLTLLVFSCLDTVTPCCLLLVCSVSFVRMLWQLSQDTWQ